MFNTIEASIWPLGLSAGPFDSSAGLPASSTVPAALPTRVVTRGPVSNTIGSVPSHNAHSAIARPQRLPPQHVDIDGPTTPPLRHDEADGNLQQKGKMEMLMTTLAASGTTMQNSGDDNHLVADGVARVVAIWTDRISYLSCIGCQNTALCAEYHCKCVTTGCDAVTSLLSQHPLGNLSQASHNTANPTRSHPRDSIHRCEGCNTLSIHWSSTHWSSTARGM